ncbi:1-acyl-sn-glycerol-3-phosphate acyltransferase [Novosphingobium sp. TH158]|uniref:lysophospholipid acyltransferase family protein n=1 Tax=Novosphingobium sp. TH158 TaxID=2067455 RepID=UPI000C7BA17A|nr:lysophospholipid acyltransferase family protein [Novosphingobium sp. TH158]PLK26684.1 1-acyl-sn-glycerol-3-phosphate acyltransferase [Novosphingobium sp. TH158]
MIPIGAALRSLAFYLAFYLGSFLLALASVPASYMDRRRMVWLAEGWARWHRWCVVNLLGIRVVVQGEVPQGRVLVAGKHESFFEAIDLPNLLNRPVPFAKSELLDIPLWGKVGVAYGMVRVERSEGAKALRAMMQSARAFGQEGRPLVIFPEGTRVPHGECPPLRSGFAGIYKLLNLPVVPMSVDSGRFYHRWIKRKGTITIHFGETIPAGLPREDIEERVRVAINALNREAR